MQAPSVDDTISVAEEDYKFGEGQLVLRVTGVGARVQIDGAMWVQVAGFEILWNGAEVWRPETLVRLPLRGLNRRVTRIG